MSDVANSQEDGIGDEGNQSTAENDEIPGRAPRSYRIRKIRRATMRRIQDLPVKHGLCRTTMRAEGDRILPLTDKEWAEHITEVRDSLSKAYEQNLNTDFVYTINGAGEVWLEERERLHDAIIEDVYERAADVPCDFRGHSGWRSRRRGEDNRLD